MLERGKPHWSFWLIAVLALLWNGAGMMNFFMQFSAEGLAGFPPKYQAIIADRPAWATVGFGVGAVTSVLGAIALLLRKAWAVPVFVVSMIGLIVALVDAAPKQVASGEFGTGELILTVALPVILSAFLIWYAGRARAQNWIT